MSKMDTLQQYWHTLSHLRPGQVAGQVWNRIKPLRRWYFQQQRQPQESFPGCRWSSEVTWLAPPANSNTAEAIQQGLFTFINESRHIEWPPRWPVENAPKLWQYNLHYFEWLWLLPPKEAVLVAEDWIAFSQSHPEHTGWEPYPICLRLLNWVGYFFVTHQRFSDEHPEHREMLWQSIARQAHWLQHHLEYHLMGNHLLENAATLALLGSGFQGTQARQWRDIGFALLQQELPEQILPDGLHFELSPMYHLRILYLMKLLVDFGDPGIARLARTFYPSMQDALQHLTHPDGQIALFNDAAFGIYHEPGKLLDSEHSPSSEKLSDEQSWSLPDAGYYGARTTDGSYVVCDVGLPGPDYIPGHAHGDLFSFELSLRGQRIFVDSGVFDYVASTFRDYCRSTRAHNTVEIDGEDQSEFWGAFRVARRGHPHDVLWTEEDNGFALQAWHDGYLRLPDKPTRHERRFRWEHTGRLEIVDTITSPKPVRVLSRLHLHPDCSIRSQTSREAILQTPVGDITVTFEGPGELLSQGSEESWYCPRFGCAEPNEVLCYRALGSHLSIRFVVE